MVLTGDLVDGSVRLLNEAVAPLASVKSTYGNFYVTGMILLVYNIAVSYKRLCHYQIYAALLITGVGYHHLPLPCNTNSASKVCGIK